MSGSRYRHVASFAPKTDRKSTRLNSSHSQISYAVFCLKKKRTLAFGIGTTEVGHVLATQCLLQRKPRTLAVNVSGGLRAGVTAKHLILSIIGRLGLSAGTGHVIEYRGDTIRALDMDERMTVCNMSIEAGARAGMIAPDETTYRYLEGRPRAPRGEAWERALEAWRALPTDALARFDREVELDAAAVEPMITYGTNPGMVIPIGGAVPPGCGAAPFSPAPAHKGLAPRGPVPERPPDGGLPPHWPHCPPFSPAPPPRP